jgi:AcrR family transcriptional regulator
MARRSDHSREEIRDMALVAAEQIVSEHGFDALNARKIASAIGYTVGTLYLVFKNLDDLILQLNARTLEELHGRLADTAGTNQQCEQRLNALARTYVDFACEHTHRWELIFQHRLPPEEVLPEWYEAKIAAAFGLVEAALAELAPTRPPEQVAEAARALWGGVHGICILALTNKLGVAGSSNPRASVESLVTHYLYGFRALSPG